MEEWVIWPDGTTALKEDVDRGDYDWMSDDYRPATPEEVAAQEGECDA